MNCICLEIVILSVLMLVRTYEVLKQQVMGPSVQSILIEYNIISLKDHVYNHRIIQNRFQHVSHGFGSYPPIKLLFCFNDTSSMDRQILATFWHILTHFDIFDPLRVKISTLPPLCFMIYHIFLKLINYKKFQIPKKNGISLLGLAPKVLRVCP